MLSVSRAAQRLSKSTQADIRRHETGVEREIVVLYQLAAKQLSGRIQSISARYPTTRLRRSRKILETVLRRVSSMVTLRIQRHLAMAARIGLRGSERQGLLVHQEQQRLREQSPFRLEAQFGVVNQRVVRNLNISLDGRPLSDRIWDIHSKTLDDMSRLMADNMAAGVSGRQTAQEMKRFLVISDVDMRTKKWREFFKQYPPGRGRYRSAYKNVERVLRTEGMRAVRLANIEYGKSKSWVKGMKWTLSAAHPREDICDEFATQDIYDLGPGIYPPDSTPDSAHPHCFCYLTPVPKDELTGKG